MRQFTTFEQTAKLIELGFEKPKSAISVSWDVPEDDGIMINANSIEFDYSYSIGELIEMLPIDFVNEYDDSSWLVIEAGAEWRVTYKSFTFVDYRTDRRELIDALYNMCVKLKEEGVI